MAHILQSLGYDECSMKFATNELHILILSTSAIMDHTAQIFCFKYARL